MHLDLNWISIEIKKASHPEETQHLHSYLKLRGTMWMLNDSLNSAESLNWTTNTNYEAPRLINHSSPLQIYVHLLTRIFCCHLCDIELKYKTYNSNMNGCSWSWNFDAFALRKHYNGEKSMRGKDCKISYQMVRGEKWEMARETNNSQNRDTKDKRMR